VRKSQRNKRRAAALRIHAKARREVARTPRGRTRPSRPPVLLSVAEQVGLVAALSMSHVGFNRWRLALGGARRGLASLPTLREARKEMYSLPGKQVLVTGSGAHLASLAADVQEKVNALCDAGLFIEMPVSGALLTPTPSEHEPAVGGLRGSPPSSMPDMQVTLGLDKGGDPGTVNIVATRISQPHPNSPSNTILEGVCPCLDDKYDELTLMLESYLPQMDALLLDGVRVRGVRRPMRLLLGSDYAAQCDVLGHKGASATQPCLVCMSTRSPSGAHAVLDAAYGTLQDVFVSRHLREATHYSDRMAADGGTLPVGDPGTSEHRCSVERSPLLAINPKQIVPIPLHTTQGVSHRYLRLEIEMVMVFRTASDGAAEDDSQFPQISVCVCVCVKPHF